MTPNTKTQLCGLLGYPVEHSLSPAIHNAAFHHLGVNAVYLAFPVEDLEGAMRGVRALGNVRGFSVTIPHKVAVIPYLDDIESTARHIGSVNTIVKEEGRLIGYNTDASGALAALQQAGIALEGRRIVLVGTGGAARAIAFGLAMRAGIARLALVGIDADERARLAHHLRERTAVEVDEYSLTEAALARAFDAADVLVHCTPVGMSPKNTESCIPKHLLSSKLVVMDIVYNPLDTQLIRDAMDVGCRTIKGLEMFLHQAVEQFELWTGQPAPVDVMRAVLEAHFQ
ncbi:MAG: shikimate dehydrogenase [Nitrospirae bacterium]|nr:MAG: shikimate dehydrogenase [Nitrospirota bacterium]